VQKKQQNLLIYSFLLFYIFDFLKKIYWQIENEFDHVVFLFYSIKLDTSKSDSVNEINAKKPFAERKQFLSIGKKPLKISLNNQFLCNILI
jgi:hypothetical protein